LKIFSDFSRENHGHGGHEHGVGRGVFDGKLSFKKMSPGGVFLQENPHFWVRTIKVRPPDGSLGISSSKESEQYVGLYTPIVGAVRVFDGRVDAIVDPPRELWPGFQRDLVPVFF
jgi:hypothetical protein